MLALGLRLAAAVSQGTMLMLVKYSGERGIALPEIMFRDTSAFAAMGRSFRACVRNLPALLVFLVLAFIAIVILYIALSVVGAIVGAIAGPTAMQVVLQLLGSALVMPAVMSAVYFAWRQMLGERDAAAAPPAVAGFEA